MTRMQQKQVVEIELEQQTISFAKHKLNTRLLVSNFVHEVMICSK